MHSDEVKSNCLPNQFENRKNLTSPVNNSRSSIDDKTKKVSSSRFQPPPEPSISLPSDNSKAKFGSSSLKASQKQITIMQGARNSTSSNPSLPNTKIVKSTPPQSPGSTRGTDSLIFLLQTGRHERYSSDKLPQNPFTSSDYNSYGFPAQPFIVGPKPSTLAVNVSRNSKPDIKLDQATPPQSPGSLRRTSSLYGGRDSPNQRTNESSEGSNDSRTLYEADRRACDEFDSKITWVSTFFPKIEDVILATQKNFFSSKNKFRSCKEIVKDLMSVRHKLGSAAGMGIPTRMIQSLKSIPDSIKAYDIINAFVNYISSCLVNGKYAEYWELKYRTEMQESTIRDHWRDAGNIHRVRFIDEEVSIRTKREVREKAAGIVYHLFLEPDFCDSLPKLPTNIAWLKVITLGMAKPKKRQMGIEELARLIKLEDSFEQNFSTCLDNKDVYGAHAFLINLIKEIFKAKGYMHPDCSNKEIAADVLKKILTEKIRLMQRDERNSKLLKQKSEPSLDKNGSMQKDSSQIIHILTRADLELLYFLDLPQCSSVVSYLEWSDAVSKFFKSENSSMISRILDPLSNWLKRTVVQKLERKLEDFNIQEEGRKKASNLIKVANGIIDYLERKKEERFDQDGDFEYFKSALFMLSMISLQMAQNMFEQRIQQYYKEEKEKMRVTHEDLYETVFSEILKKIFQPEEGPFSYFLTRYHQLAALPQETQAFVYFENFRDLAARESQNYQTHRRNASLSRSQVGSGRFNPSVLLQIQENVHSEIQKSQQGKKAVEYLKREYDFRCLFWSTQMRYFKEMYLKDGPLSEILEGSGSLRVRRPVNTAKDDLSKHLEDLRATLTAKFKEWFNHETVRSKLLPQASQTTTGQQDENVYYKIMGEQYFIKATNKDRAERLFVRFPLEKTLRSLESELKDLLALQGTQEPTELKVDGKGRGSLKAPSKPTERDLLTKELQLVARLSNLPESETSEKNKDTVIALFEELFCSTLDITPAAIKVKRHHSSIVEIVHV